MRRKENRPNFARVVKEAVKVSLTYRTRGFNEEIRVIEVLRAARAKLSSYVSQVKLEQKSQVSFLTAKHILGAN